MGRLRLALCQMNAVVGDLAGNAERIRSWLERADAAGADLAVFPELALTGYPPEDLLLKPGFVVDNLVLAEKLASASGECAAIFGFVDADIDLYNAAAICARGKRWGTYHKQMLPNYAVFDEQRYFARGSGAEGLWRVAGVTVGVTICEDAWAPAGPVASQAAAGAELILSINASPFSAGRREERIRMLATRAADASCSLAYVNMVGGQDELIFDGGSMVFDAEGRLTASAPQFEEHLLVVDLDLRPVFRKRLLDPRGRALAPPRPVEAISEQPRADLRSADAVAGSHEGTDPARAVADEPEVDGFVVARGEIAPARPLDPAAEVYEALVLGTRDYVHKNGFSDAVIGLSGGIDSSLVAVIATDALGPAHVHGVTMPSRFSSPGSRSDAADLAQRLAIDFREIPIEQAHVAFLDLLAPSFAGRDQDLTEENLQSRVRGVLLMALSNKFGWIVLTTGNKSELATGYSTLYGDSAGGFAVIKDVPKTLVYQLCRYRNGGDGDGGPIPEVVLVKPPSAELRPDQRDDQSLPPYELLDPILQAYVEDDRTAAELVEEGYDPALVARIVRLVDLAEYKRRQSPPGVRVTPKAFGKDRRVPITNRYR